jgi:hypothetical protein
MWPEEKLREIAEDVGEKLAAQLPGLEAAFAKIEADLETSKRAADRAATYVPMIEGKLQCPHCFVQAARESTVIQIDGPVGVDTYRCQHRQCAATFRFPT